MRSMKHKSAKWMKICIYSTRMSINCKQIFHNPFSHPFFGKFFKIRRTHFVFLQNSVGHTFFEKLRISFFAPISLQNCPSYCPRPHAYSIMFNKANLHIGIYSGE
uniref:(northern house mosquito) hypothetical protein n=1 Tax=Culex pipiens TaxID=7175 RepID=A0A8D8AZU0_CULPI